MYHTVRNMQHFEARSGEMTQHRRWHTIMAFINITNHVRDEKKADNCQHKLLMYS